jgi:hypothetical protein
MQIVKIDVHERAFDSRYNRARRAWRDYNKAPRVYVSIQDENILQNLANRTVRPYIEYKKLIKKPVFAALGISAADWDLSWNQNAGCSMCPCSPGFVLKKTKGYSNALVSTHFDVWVTISGKDAAIAHDKQPRFVAELV